MSTIATTEAIESKRDKLLERGVVIDGSDSTTIDLHWDYSTITRNRVTSLNPVMGYRRLTSQQNYALRQTRRLQKVMSERSFERYRCLTKFPERFNDYNGLREAWVRIQMGAYINAPYIVVQKDETPSAVKAHIGAFFQRFEQVNLVLDMDAPLDVLGELIEWALVQKTVDEIVLLNTVFADNRAKFWRVMNFSLQNPDKFHLCGAYWNLSRHGSEPMLATLLLAFGFKSVSFQPAPIPPYMFRNIRGRAPRSPEQRIDDAVWVNDETMTYEAQHHRQCVCFGRRNIQTLLNTVRVDACVCHHNMTRLLTRYELMRASMEERERILQLEILQPLLLQLRGGR